MEKMYTLKQEILSNFSETSETLIGIDNKYGECVIGSISIKELFNGRHKTLLNKKVKDVFKGTNENEFIFIINSKA